MQERTLENLILENEDYIFAGDLTITGKVQLNNASLIVSGTLTLTSDAEIKGGDIACGSIDSYNIYISDGDIYVNGNADVAYITSDGNIEVGGDSYAGDINCFNYLVSGDNDSRSITAIQDVYILGCNNSCDIKARDVLIGEDCDFNDYGLIAKSFECSGEIERCSSMSVG